MIFMARFGIIAAMPVELEHFVAKYNAGEVKAKGFFKIYEGKIGTNEVVLACSGIGKVNAASCTQKLIDCYRVDYIINMGIAGGISKTLHTLDVVIGSELVYHDFNPLNLLDKYYPFTSLFKCDEKLIETARKVCSEAPEVKNYYVERIASGDCFVESGNVKARIRDELGGYCCEMEGAAIGHVAHANGVPFLIIRTISDLADEDASVSYSEFEKQAAIQSNHIVGGILELLS